MCRPGIVHPAKNLPRELGKMMGVVVAMGRKKAYNKTINRVRPCALSAASTGSCAADEGKTRGAMACIPLLHGLGCRRGRLRPRLDVNR